MYKWLACIVLVVSLLSCDVYYVEEGYDSEHIFEDENSSFETAQFLESWNSGAISYEGDSDYFYFNAEAGETYRFHMAGISGFEPLLELYNSSFSLLEVKGPGISNSGFDWWGYNPSGEYLEAEKESIVFTAESSGIYYLCVGDIYNAHHQGLYEIYFEHQIDIPQVQNLQLEIIDLVPALELSWDSLSVADGYQVYRVEINDAEEMVGSYQMIAQLESKALYSYRDSSIEVNQSYRYFVCAVLDQEEGPASETVQGSIELSLNRVENASAIAMNQAEFEIQVTWDPVEGAEGYRIYRSEMEETGYGEIHSQSSAEPCLYNDTNIMANQQYFYVIVAYFRNVVSPDSTPTGAYFDWNNFKSNMDIIDASQGLSGRIEIRFEEKYDNANIVRYDIYRAEDEENPVYEGPIGSFYANDSIGSLVSDTEINTGQYYFYCVKIILNTEEGEVSSDYSWFDSGRAE